MQEKINTLKSEFEKNIKTVDTLASLENIRLSLLGKKGELTSMLRELSALAVDEKKQVGSLINELKTYITEALKHKEALLETEEVNLRMIKEKIDYTLPSRRVARGSIHPVSQVMAEIQGIFSGLGFVVAEGPEIESDYYNFSALNFPLDHPARDMHDTFYIDNIEPRLLCTHTSGTQIHVLEKFSPPVRVIMPGKVFRSDADISHSPVFHQIEGLYVDKNVTFAHLKGVLQYFLDNIFYKNAPIRLRPSFFPFTEPSVEVDVQCVICKGKGCSMCKQSGWIEILGAGMVDPNVLSNVGVDPEVYSGFAFGVGLERIAILKYGINNIKLFFDNHLYFMEQF